MNFSLFKLAVAKQFERMRKHQLFRTGVEKDDLWTTYLASFPAGSNPIYRVRTEHDCSCCKQFIRIMGNVVAIIDGKMETIWDGFVEDSNYQLVSTAMAEAVRSKPIIDAFLHYERTAGTDKNFEETVTGAKTWTHFFVNIPARFVFKKADIATNLNDYRTAHDVFKRGLEEITFEAINTVLELIAQNSLYRGEEHKFAVTEFKKVSLKASLLPPEEREAFYWVQAMTLPVSVSCFRNTVIGTLLVDLSADVDLETAVKSFEAKVAPTNYKRPTALITKAMINKAKAKIEELGLTSALQRRYATIDVERAGRVPEDAQRKANRLMPAEKTMDNETTTDAGSSPVERPVRPGSEAHKLTDSRIADLAFAVLREHNDNRLWRALTYDSGPYDVTTPTLALCHLARVFFGAGVAAEAGKAEGLRIALNFIAEQFSSDWPDRCQINVQAARRALAVEA